MKNIRDREKAINHILKMADDAIQIGQQLTALATRLKSDAQSAREELGVPSGQTRKGKDIVSPEILLKYKARLTR